MATQAATDQKTDGSLDTGSFTGHPSVVSCLRELKDHFGVAGSEAKANSDDITGGSNGKPAFIVSDVLDDNGYQYVNLVQKGGGVLGIALVGYTYILEQMGIRFLRLAGTSAGAINTSLMTVIGKKEDTKSEAILNELCKLKFFELVDGHPAARLVIGSFLREPDFFARLKKWLSYFVIAFVLLLAGGFVFLGLQQTYHWATYVTRTVFVFTGIYFLILGVGAAYAASLLKRLKNSGFGINPGDFFYDWIKKLLADNGVKTVNELTEKASKAPALHLRKGVTNEAGIADLKGDVTFITSELVTENKFQLPAMCNLFRATPEGINNLAPAGFVRASMAIPVFFESYFIKDIPCSDPEIKRLWKDTFDEDDPPETVRFVDGGILSNFPINLFYNKDIKVPRLPTFGIDLDDSKPDDSSKHAASWSLGGYLGRMFNTIRFNYDKDFLLQNKVMKQGVGKVPLSQYNWLNFFLKDEEKIGMFVAGAEAAKKFLLEDFSWEKYKGDRAALPQQLTASKTPHVGNS